MRRQPDLDLLAPELRRAAACCCAALLFALQRPRSAAFLRAHVGVGELWRRVAAVFLLGAQACPPPPPLSY